MKWIIENSFELFYGIELFQSLVLDSFNLMSYFFQIIQRQIIYGNTYVHVCNLHFKCPQWWKSWEQNPSNLSSKVVSYRFPSHHEFYLFCQLFFVGKFTFFFEKILRGGNFFISQRTRFSIFPRHTIVGKSMAGSLSLNKEQYWYNFYVQILFK